MQTSKTTWIYLQKTKSTRTKAEPVIKILNCRKSKTRLWINETVNCEAKPDLTSVA